MGLRRGPSVSSMGNSALAVQRGPARLERAEPVVRRLLLVPEGQPKAGRARDSDAAAHRLFNVSIALSGLRCLISYVVLPVLTPALGAAARVAPVIGIPIAVVAL